MKFFIIWSVFLLILNFAWAGLDGDVLIQGRIHSFDKEKATVVDAHNQMFNLSRNYFPKDFVFKTGQMFMLEMKFEDFEKLQIKKLENK